MENYAAIKAQVQEDGFAIVNEIFSIREIATIITAIENAPSDKLTFRKTQSLFAIRQFLVEVPQVQKIIFADKLMTLINGVFGSNYFVVKSIYFDKPPASNWFVSWHQDLTISVKGKQEMEGFGPWTVKQNQFAVQPPVSFLENIFTVRIHLDDTGENNGALKVVPASHTGGIERSEKVKDKEDKQAICDVNSGGVMLMKPLLWHGSSKSTNEKRRRVIHIEFSNQSLPDPLQWSEYLRVD